MQRIVIPSVVAVLVAGCDPQNAQLSVGDFTAFLAETNSLTVARGAVQYQDYESYHAVDCREFETARNPRENEALRLEDRLRICDGDPNDQWPPVHEIWLTQNGYHVFSDSLNPWRGEAIITSEGDVQIGFHQELKGGQDFRFLFVIDPAFQPRECVQNEAGDGVEWRNIDGDWVEQWSRGLPDGSRRYFLNSGSYQINPTDLDGGRWYLPLEWQAGYGQGKFGDDQFIVRSTRYGRPEAYIRDSTAENTAGAGISESDLFWCEFDAGDDATESRCMEFQFEEANRVADAVLDELNLVGVPEDSDALPSARPVVQNNDWRVPDGRFSGFDGWQDFVYSWVTFDPGSELVAGGAASGEFNLFFDAADSQSRFHVRGRFTVDSFKADWWTTDFLPPIKFEENDTLICGEPYDGGTSTE